MGVCEVMSERPGMAHVAAAFSCLHPHNTVPPSNDSEKLPRRVPFPWIDSALTQKISKRSDGINSLLMRRHKVRLARRPAARVDYCSIPGACDCYRVISTELWAPSRNDLNRCVGVDAVLSFRAANHCVVKLNHATEIATEAQFDRAGNAIEVADAEIRRFHALIQQAEELDEEFEKIKNLRAIVRTFRSRVEEAGRRLG